MFYSHIDVVPADEDWQPFTPRLEEGKIFGRGAADVKGSIVGLLLGLEDELARIIKEVTGTTGKYGTMGSGDLPSSTLKWGAIPFGFGVARGDSNIHGREESVNLQDIYNIGEIISRLLI
ncbi:MAG: M20/M25/M40 family metallo-hydrolase [Thermodesulfovibrionales bacterium]|nr:M20/M25/M40 family metallo-hydrolase [Thermodesulfovibrionales bacterium]